MRRGLLCLGCAALLIGTRPGILASDPKWEPVSRAELAEEKPILEPEAPAEILSYRLEINDKVAGKRDFTRAIRFKIFDPSRATGITRISRFWNGPSNPYYEISARLTLPDGSTREFGLNDLRERSLAEEGRANGLLGLITAKSNRGVAEKFLAITGVVKGAVLDIWESEPKVQQTNWLINAIQRPETPIRRFRYVSRYSLDDEVEHRVFVLHPSGGKIAEDKKEGMLTFTAENLPSIRREPFSAPDSYFSLTIIESYESLSIKLDPRTQRVPTPKPVPLALGPWAFFSTTVDFYDAANGFPTTLVKEKAGELAAGAADDREKARRIYVYVQSLYKRFRERADLESSYTGYARSMDDVINFERVDSTIFQPSDFYFLYVSLARSAGLECHSVYHPLRTNFPFKIGMVSQRFLESRTVAVKTGGTWILCDPCSDTPLAFGTLHWEVENQPAMMAAPNQQLFLNVPSPRAERSRTEANADLELDKDGNLQGECVLSFTGHVAHQIRERLENSGREDWGQLTRTLFDLETSYCEARLISVEGLDSPEEPVRVRAFVRWPAYAEIAGQRILLPVSVFARSRPPLLNASARTTPVFFRFPSSAKDSITIRLPQGYAPEALPEPSETDIGDFSYSLSTTSDAATGQLVVRREAISRAVEIPVAGYARAWDWFRRVTAADQAAVVLVRKAATPTDATPPQAAAAPSP
jgi:hypothetical protein